tara:strand:- start:503 stop:670 length:168 start_codon:yes stop_codon:yes gene_type:complete
MQGGGGFGCGGGDGGSGWYAGIVRALASEQTSRMASHSVLAPAERVKVLLLPQQW